MQPVFLPISSPSEYYFLQYLSSENWVKKQKFSKVQLITIIGFLTVWLLYRDEKPVNLSFREFLSNPSSLCEIAIRIFVFEYLNHKNGNYGRFLKWEFEEVDILRLYFHSQIIKEVQSYIITDMLTLQRHNVGFFILAIFKQEIIKENSQERIKEWLNHVNSQNRSYESYVRELDRDVNSADAENVEIFMRIGVLLLLNKQLKPISIQQIIGRAIIQYPSYYKSQERSIKNCIQRILDKGLLLSRQNKKRNGPRL